MLLTPALAVGIGERLTAMLQFHECAIRELHRLASVEPVHTVRDAIPDDGERAQLIDEVPVDGWGDIGEQVPEGRPGLVGPEFFEKRSHRRLHLADRVVERVLQ